MTESRKPWHGVLVATALPFNDDLSVDYDAYAEHVRFLANAGCDGVAPNGSLGEYQTLSEEERARVITTAVEAAPEGFTVMAGVGAYGGLQTRKWAEQAAEAGAGALMLLPRTPTGPPTKRSWSTIASQPQWACPSWRTTTRSTPRWT